MADVLVRFNQAANDLQSWGNLRARHLGYSVESRGFWFKEDDATTNGKPVFFPSVTGQGGNSRRVSSLAHDFTVGTMVVPFYGGFFRATPLQFWGAATHMVTRVIDADTIEIASAGAWDVPAFIEIVFSPGWLYLSPYTPGGVTQFRPSQDGPYKDQRVGYWDGSAIHLTLTDKVDFADPNISHIRSPVWTIMKTPDPGLLPAENKRVLIHWDPTPGTEFEGYGDHIATWTGSSWEIEYPLMGWQVLVQVIGITYQCTVGPGTSASQVWRPLMSAAGFTSLRDRSSYSGGEFVIWDTPEQLPHEDPPFLPPVQPPKGDRFRLVGPTAPQTQPSPI